MRRRNFPAAVSRLRLFRGSLPEYVRDVLLRESTSASLFVQIHVNRHFFQPKCVFLF